MITRPHRVAEQIFWILSKDIIETKFQSKYERNWMHISPKLKLSRFMCFNKLIIHGFLCCSLFLEWVHLGANALGIQLVSLIPSKYLSFRKIWGPPWIHISDQYLHCLLKVARKNYIHSLSLYMWEDFSSCVKSISEKQTVLRNSVR